MLQMVAELMIMACEESSVTAVTVRDVFGSDRGSARSAGHAL